MHKLDKTAAQLEAFLRKLGLTDFIYEISGDLLEVYYSYAGKNYWLATYGGRGWTCFFDATDWVNDFHRANGSSHLKDSKDFYYANGSFSLKEVKEIIKGKVDLIRLELPKTAAGEAASFFMAQLYQESGLPLNESLPYVGYNLSWQQILLFAEVRVPVDRIEDAKILPDEWVRKMFTHHELSEAGTIDL